MSCHQQLPVFLELFTHAHTHTHTLPVRTCVVLPYCCAWSVRKSRSNSHACAGASVSAPTKTNKVPDSLRVWQRTGICVCVCVCVCLCVGNVEIATPFTGGRAGGGWRDDPPCRIRSHLWCFSSPARSSFSPNIPPLLATPLNLKVGNHSWIRWLAPLSC